MKILSNGRSLALILALVGCGNGDPNTAGGVSLLPSETTSAKSPESSGASSPLQLYTIPPEVENVVAFHVLPDALCQFSSGDKAQGLEIVSDAQGNAYVTVTLPSAGLVVHPEVSCSTRDGTTAMYSLEIRSAQGVVALRAPRPRGRPRPALANPAFDRTDDELRAGGYPPRPDRTTQSRAYDHWLAGVSSPAWVVDADVGRAPGLHRRAAPGQNANWAGAKAQAGATPFYEVLGEWTHPSATFPVRDARQRYDATFWVGLGDASTSTMWQSGSDVTSYSLKIGTVYPVFTTNSIWMELVGNCQQIVFNPPPSAGDVISSWMWFSTNSSCQGVGITGDNATQYLALQIQNQTANLVYNWCQPVTWFLSNPTACSASPVTGGTAEWILERELYSSDTLGPSQCSGQNYLPNLMQVTGASTISLANAYNTQWTAASALNPTMMEMDNSSRFGFCCSNTGDKLADATVQSSNVMMNWYAFK